VLFTNVGAAPMCIKIAVAASLTLLATASSRAEDNKACVLKATETLPRIAGLVVKKIRTRPVAAAILATWPGKTRPIIVDGYRRGGSRRNLFIHVCDDEGGSVRAPGDEVAIPTRQQRSRLRAVFWVVNLSDVRLRRSASQRRA
jgi:hypothetical protein